MSYFLQDARCRIGKLRDSNAVLYKNDGVDQVNKDSVRNKFDYSGNRKSMFSAWRGKVALAAHAVVACSTLLYGGAAFAWGFGEMRVLSALTEPFRSQVNLIGSDVANAEKNCFKARLLSFDGVSLGTASVSFRENSHTLLVSTRNPVNEPAAALTVSYTCSPQMQREYAILLDLPLAQPSAPLVSSQRQESVAMPSSSDTANKAASEAAPAKKPRRTAPAATDSANASNQAQSNGQAPSTSKSRKDAERASNSAKNVLKLGSNASVPDEGYVFRQRLALSYQLSVVPAEVAGTDDIAPDSPPADIAQGDAALRQLQEKMTALERKTEALQKQNAEQLQALEQAKNAPAATSFTYILYLLLLACALAIGWLIWRMRQVRSEAEQASWQDMVPSENQSEWVEEADTATSVQSSFYQDAPEQDAASGGVGSALAMFGRKMRRRTDLSTRPISPAPELPRQALELDEPFAGMNVVIAEEILDEIQEAEFWVHMNQPERAISILETEAQPTSPLRWLHLFDLYRMTGDQARYESLAVRFKLAFNGRVAPWEQSEADKGQRSIDEFPHVMAQIMKAWPTDGLVQFLEDLLLDNREGHRQGFDLPAYQDLLFLTNIAYQVQALRAAESQAAGPEV